MKEHLSMVFSFLFLLLIVPYLVTIFINGPQSCLKSKNADPEEFLPFLVSRQIPGECDAETMKAQAVITRTNFYFQMQTKDMLTVLKESFQKHSDLIWFQFLKDYPKFTDAAEATEELVLTKDGEFYQVPYHKVSAGITRSGSEILGEEYSYLESVDSRQDKESYQYLTSVYVEKSRLPDKLEIGEKDSQGYVMTVFIDGEGISGEAFAKEMGLASSNFSIQEVGEKIRFLCRGEGHGFGMSQFGADFLAEEGDSYKEILSTYFPQFELERKTVVNKGRF